MPAERLTTLARLRRVSALRTRLNRVRRAWLPILQLTIAAALSYFVAQTVFGHAQPFFAPISAVIILGMSGGERANRAVEMAMGVVVGVGLGDVLVSILGTGFWQLALALCIGLIVGTFLSTSMLLVNQVVISTVLIFTIMPPDMVNEGAGAMDRMVDAFVGSVVGVVVIALLPASPLSSVRAEVSKILGMTSSVLHDVSEALTTGDTEALEEALEAVHGTQSDVDNMIMAGKSSRESTIVSPLLWRTRRRMRSLEITFTPVDNLVRNTKVLARRAVTLTRDQNSVSQAQIEIIVELSDVANALSEVFERRTAVREATEIPQLVRQLRFLGARVGMDVAANGVLSQYVILAQSRSLVVDMLQICGMSQASAVAVLAPTSDTPAILPELWKDDEPPAPQA